jgi:hypothetical protein
VYQKRTSTKAIIAETPITPRDDQGKFPDYPSDDEGGSGVIFNPEKYASGYGADAAAEKSTEPSKAKTLKAKRPGQGLDKKGKGKDGLGVAEEEDDESGFVLRQTDFVRQLRTAHSTFQGIPQSRDRDWYE